MSTFSGKVVDPTLQFVAIDYFGLEVHDADIFLLSHHHCDHMKGIFTSQLANVINNSPKKEVHCSVVTAHFLRKNNRCHIRDDKIKPLEINKARVIRHDLIVTCLPAAHCPGSVMFLIEHLGKRILYTGDIRLTVDDLKKFVGTLTNEDGSLIRINDLYLDTTFAITSPFNSFPSRESSEETFICLIDEFLSASPDRKVIIDVGAKFGYESLYIKLFKKFKKPIMLHDNLMAYYQDIEEFREYVIGYSKGKNTHWRIHVCLNFKKSECNLRTSMNTKIIKPCVLGFVKYPTNSIKIHEKYNVPYKDLSQEATKIFYATHCSLNELREVYSFLQPDKVFPSVRNDRSFKEILRLIGADNKQNPEEGLRVIKSTKKSSREEYEEKRKKFRLL